MHRAAKHMAVVLLASLLVASARPASVCVTGGLECPSQQSEMSASFAHSKDATKGFFAQGRHTSPVKHLSSFPVYPCVVEFAGCETDFFLLQDVRPRLFDSSLYFSSLCNKAPPVA